MSKPFSIVFFIVITHSSFQAQISITQLIDSLAFVSESSQKSVLSNRIAKELKDIDWERTLHYLEYSEKEAGKSGSYKTLANFYITAADIYYEKDVLDVALNYYQKAYEIYKQNNDIQQIFKLENDLAIIYARLNNKDKALYYFKKVYNFQAKQQDSIYLAQILNNIGTLYIEKNIDSSEIFYLKALKIAKKLQDTKLNAYLYTNLGRVYFKKNEHLKAKKYFAKAINLTEKDLENDVKSMIYQLTSEYFYKNKEYDSAIYYAGKAMNLLKNVPYSFKKQNVVRILYKTYLNKKDYQNASKYFELYDAIRDSINVEEKAVNVERLKLEQEYKTKKQIALLKEKKRKFRYIIIGLSLVSGLLILIIILVKYKNKLSKVQLEKELVEAKRQELLAKLELKNRSLISKAMTEIHRTEIIQSIINDLKRVKLKAVKKETERDIDRIINRLSKDMNNNVWNEFEISFAKVHERFIRNLNKKHPNLTSKDRRLCSLLLLNLTTKEIALIFGQSVKSVENARTRLRKKLGLTNAKIDLTTYLNSIS